MILELASLSNDEAHCSMKSCRRAYAADLMRVRRPIVVVQPRSRVEWVVVLLDRVRLLPPCLRATFELKGSLWTCIMRARSFRCCYFLARTCLHVS